LTGFEPFGEHDVNPSALVAAALDGYAPPGARVQAARLPVHWQDTTAALDQLLTVRPAWVLLLGLAGRATTIRVEMRAANVAGPIRDNAQQLPPQPILDPAGSPSRASSFPGPRLVARLQAAGLPAELSTDAGQYLCNLALYHTLGRLARLTLGGRPPVAGFIHLPPLPTATAPGLPLPDQIRAVRLVIDTLTSGR
jgi:pyroglutamyl-peptidase